MSLEYAWVLLLLPLPWLVYKWAPPRREAEQSLQVPFFERLIEATGTAPGKVAVVRRKRRAQQLMLLISWAAMLLVLAQPVRYGAVVEQRAFGRDLMVAVDLSQSMQKRDFPDMDGQKKSRWDGLLGLMVPFAEGRQGDRLGLIAFGSGAYLQVPFSADSAMWVKLLQQLQTGMAGPATAIGDAIGLAIRSFDKAGSRRKMLILVTDGSDNASRLPAVEAAKVAAAEQVVIYTIAVGDPDTQQPQDKVDVASLRRISEITGGNSYLAIDSQSLQAILDEIGKAQPSAYDTVRQQPKTLLYPWIIAPVFMLYLALWLWLSVQEIVSHRRARHG